MVHIDIDPQEQVQGRKAANLLIKADAVSGVNAVIDSLTGHNIINWRSEDMKVKAAAALVLPETANATDGYLHPLGVIENWTALSRQHATSSTHLDIALIFQRR